MLWRTPVCSTFTFTLPRAAVLPPIAPVQPAHLVTMRGAAIHRGETVQLPGGITSTDLRVKVPLAYDSMGKPKGKGEIEVFARELVLTKHKSDASRPAMLFLQGGPGFPSPRVGSKSGWWGKALNEYQIILLDQRGTGKSSPVTHETLSQLASSDQQLEYLVNFRADSIVRDCEVLRRGLLGEGKWVAVLGHSFGGFCLLTYLSMFPNSIARGLFTGGIPPAARTIDEVYQATYKRCAARNKRFYQRYPLDVQRVRDIVTYLESNQVQLPAGGHLTVRRFLQLGILLGAGSGFETLHYLLSEAWIGGDPSKGLSYGFLKEIEALQSIFDIHPIYAILHEQIYCRSKGESSQWSASRILGTDDCEIFQWRKSLEQSASTPIYFTGEMVFPWMLEDYAALKNLKEVAEKLANYSEWPGQLYRLEELQKCQVPCAAAVYYDDMYVELEYSEEVAHMMPDCKIWVTNRYQHSGLRDDGEKIFSTLLGMVNGEENIPS
ncbi:unnamed protein product [Chrysoparadoxa australica]